MKRPSLTQKLASLRALLSGREEGQAMAEYSIVTVLLFGSTLAAVAGAPFAKTLFVGLQDYVDLFFYALNLAVG